MKWPRSRQSGGREWEVWRRHNWRYRSQNRLKP